MQQLTGGNAAAADVRSFDAGKDAVAVFTGGHGDLADGDQLCFGDYLQRMLAKLSERRFKATTVALMLLCVFGLTGCMKPYEPAGVTLKLTHRKRDS